MAKEKKSLFLGEHTGATVKSELVKGFETKAAELNKRKQSRIISNAALKATELAREIEETCVLSVTPKTITIDLSKTLHAGESLITNGVKDFLEEQLKSNNQETFNMLAATGIDMREAREFLNNGGSISVTDKKIKLSFAKVKTAKLKFK